MMQKRKNDKQSILLHLRCDQRHSGGRFEWKLTLFTALTAYMSDWLPLMIHSYLIRPGPCTFFPLVILLTHVPCDVEGGWRRESKWVTVTAWCKSSVIDSEGRGS